MKKANDSTLKQIADLDNLSYDELRALWQTLYGKEAAASNKPYLIKRLAHRIQEIAYGGLSERAHKMMDDILDIHGFDENGGKLDSRRTERKRKVGVPVVGTRLAREWNGRTYGVIVVHGGFEAPGTALQVTDRHRDGDSGIVVNVPLALKKRGGRKEVVLPQAFASDNPMLPSHQEALVVAIARAHRWQKLLDDGKFGSISDLAREIGLDVSFAARLLRLTLLAPDIIEAILIGDEPSGLSLTMLTKPLPTLWDEQREAMSFAEVSELS